MARPRFIINNKIDRKNLMEYLDRNMENVLSSFGTKDASAPFVALWEHIHFPRYVFDTDQNKIWEDTTALLYLLPPKKIDTIKISLRAKKRSAKSKSKTQLTVDSDVYDLLSSYASSETVTLSEAIRKLLTEKNNKI